MPYADPEKRRANWFKNHEERLARQREYYRKHREKRLAAKKAAYDPEKQREKNQRYYYENQERLVEYARDYRRENAETVNAKAKERYRAGGEELQARRRELSKAPHRKAKQNEHQRRWLERNPEKAQRFYAKNLIAEQTGLRARDVPDDIADAKVEQLKITRWVRKQLTAQGIEAREGTDPEGLDGEAAKARSR